MEYLTLLNYLYTISFSTRKKATKTVTFFLSKHLTMLNHLSFKTPIHASHNH